MPRTATALLVLALLLTACGDGTQDSRCGVGKPTPSEIYHLLTSEPERLEARERKGVLQDASSTSLREAIVQVTASASWYDNNFRLVAAELRRRAEARPSGELGSALGVLIEVDSRGSQADLVAALAANGAHSVPVLKAALLGPPGPQRYRALLATSRLRQLSAPLVIPTLTLYERDPSSGERGGIETVMSALLGVEECVFTFCRGVPTLSQRSLNTAFYWLWQTDPEGLASGLSCIRSHLESGPPDLKLRLLRALDTPALWRTPWQNLAAECADRDADPEVVALAREVASR